MFTPLITHDLDGAALAAPVDAARRNGTAYKTRTIDDLRIKDDRLRAAIEGTGHLLFDGGMGTMLQAAGMKAGALPELLNFEEPQVITDIQRQYVEAGCDVITANTFGANAHKLDGAATVADVFAAAVTCAREAGARYVAGDIGPIGALLRPLGTLSFDEAYDLFAEEVRAGVDAGVDLFIIETMTDLAEIKAAVLACRENSDLPVFATMTFEEDGRTFLGTSPEVAAITLDAIGAEFERDIRPGEIVVVDTAGVRSDTSHCGKAPKKLCVFEFIYFARPDSIIEGSSVHEARKQAGRFLAQEHPVEADVVIGVPDSGLDAALGYSQESGIPYGIGFIKNKYIGRTFIQGSQKQRENSVRIKLNVVTSTVKGKRVVLVDDSIVRGTTSARIIKLLRDAGAKEVHFRVSAPPFKYPCYFGTDIPDQKLLVATGRTVDQINEIIGADTLGYLSTEHVVQLAQNANCGFCTACFTGKYAVKPEEVLSTDIHERHLNDRPKDEKKLGE